MVRRRSAAGTPDYVVTRINTAVNKVLKDPALQEKIGKLEVHGLRRHTRGGGGAGPRAGGVLAKTLAAIGVKPE